jgi:hypothetical protein
MNEEILRPSINYINFYVVKQTFFRIFLFLPDKSEEEVSSAGEQLTSNRIYDFG